MPQVTDPDILRELNEGGPQPAPQRQRGPVLGPPAAPPSPTEQARINISERGADTAAANSATSAANAATTRAARTFRLMTAEEATAKGLPAGGTYQVNELGEFKIVQAPPKARSPEQIRNRQETYQRAGQTVLRSTTRALEYLDKMSHGGGFLPASSRYVQSQIIGTDEYQFVRQIEDLKRNIGLDRLQDMRDNSPTGGALGQVPVQQQAMLEETLGSFDITQPGETLRENLNQLNNIYLDIMFGSPAERADAVAAGRMTQEQNDEVEQYYRETEFDLFGRRKDQDDKPDRANSTAEKNDRLFEFMKTGASKDEIVKFADELGLNIIDMAALERNIARRDRGEEFYGFTSRQSSGGSGTGGDGGSPATPDQSQYSLENIVTGLAQGTGDIVQGVGDAVGTFTDPFGRLIGDILGYDTSQMQSLGTVAREGAGLPQSPEGIGRSARELASGALATGGIARGVGVIANPGTTANVLRELGRTPIRDTVAGAGAGAGAEIGQEAGGTLGQVAGLVAGGLGGYAGANALVSATARRAPNALSEAATRQQIDMLPADAGGPVAQAFTTGTRASPISVAPVTSAAERSQTQTRAAVGRTAGREGEVLDTQQAGETIREGAEKFIANSRQRGERLYDRAFKQARGVKSIKPIQTVRAAKEALSRLKENPAASASEVSGLESFIGAIEGGVSIQGLRDARTKLSQSVYDGSLRSSSEQAMWKGILSNVSEDIGRGLRAAGRDQAADTFEVADRIWSERVEVIDQVLQPILGRDGQKGGEQVLQVIESMARGQSGGNVRLSRLLASLGDEQAGNVRATIIDRLGRATPGNQDAQGQAFSASTFLTNWNKMTPQAKASIFNKTETRNALNDLAVIAENTKRGQSMANTSNTAIGLNAATMVAAGNIGVGGAGLYANPAATLLGAGAVYLTGRLMASPGFARLLARTAKMPPEQANRTFKQQIGILATREPMLSNDLSRIGSAINDNGALAAQEDQP